MKLSLLSISLVLFCAFSIVRSASICERCEMTPLSAELSDLTLWWIDGCGRRCGILCPASSPCRNRRDCLSNACEKDVCVEAVMTSTVPTSTRSTTIIATTRTSSTTSVPTPANTSLPNVRSWSALSITSIDTFGVMDRDAYGASNRAFVKDPTGEMETVLRVRYPAGSYNPSASPIGGTGFYATPIDLSKAKTVALEFQVFFPTGFNFVKGGKLPGLYGGGESCSGGRAAKSCFSTRYMFRAGGAGELYLYVDQAKQVQGLCLLPPLTICNPSFGISLARGSFTFKTGVWNTMTQIINLNTPGKADGSLEVLHEGKSVMKFDQVHWRSEANIGFSGIDFATFFGGSDKTWATKIVSFFWVDQEHNLKWK